MSAASATNIKYDAMIDCLLLSIIEIIDEISSILYIYKTVSLYDFNTIADL